MMRPIPKPIGSVLYGIVVLMAWAMTAGLCWCGCVAKPSPTLELPGSAESMVVKLTYESHIKPLMVRHCVACHHAEGAGPFPLTTYEDISKRTRFIAHVTETRFMPPWKANPDYRRFANERLLTQEEIDLIRNWAANGASRGTLVNDDTPLNDPLPQADPPDLTLRMREPFTIPGNNRHTYICVKIPYELPTDTFVSDIEYRPSNRQRTHHASYQFLSIPDGVDASKEPSVYVYADSAPMPNDDRQYTYYGLIGPDGRRPELLFHTGWLPGSSAQRYPDGMGFRLPKKGILLIRSLHYSPTPVEEIDQAEVRIWFADKPIERVVQFAAFKPNIALVKRKEPLIIPADTLIKFDIDNVVPLDASVLAINPHMHQLGKSFKAWAIRPAGDTIPLVHIPNWDFDWQEFYRFERLIHLPKGSRLQAEAWYDNTRDNPSNPFNPPRNIFFEEGMEDTDEMMRLVVQYVPYRQGDSTISLP